MAQRWIMHADVDAFFAAVEQRDHPELRGKPVVVGGRVERGVVSAASYEARKYGIRSGMPIAQAKHLCPDGVFLCGDYRKYQQESERILGILQEYSPAVEPLSVDEAYLDVTGSERWKGSVVALAQEIKQRVRQERGLTLSIGIGSSKLIAKMATDFGKPDGLILVPPGCERAFLAPLPVGTLWGVGPHTEARLAAHGIHTVGQLAAYARDTLQRELGEWGVQLHLLANGEDKRLVEPVRTVKSVSNEATFPEDVTDVREIRRYLLALAEEVGTRLRSKRLQGRTVVLKLRYGDFTTITRQITLPKPTDATLVIYHQANALLAGCVSPGQPYRLVGVGVHELICEETWQLGLWQDREARLGQLDRVLDAIRAHFGERAILRAPLLSAPLAQVAGVFG